MGSASPAILLTLLALLFWVGYIVVRKSYSKNLCQRVFMEKRENGSLSVDVEYEAYARSWWFHNGPRGHLYMLIAALLTLFIWGVVFGVLWPPIEDGIYAIDAIGKLEGINPSAVYNVVLVITAFLLMVFSTAFSVNLVMRRYYSNMPPPLRSFETISPTDQA